MVENFNKKAWIRVVEAVVAIMIIMTVALIVITRQPVSGDFEDEIFEKQMRILDIISSKEDLRALIVQSNEEEKIIPEIDNAIKEIAPANWKFSTKVCELDNICKNPKDVEGEVYVAERLITSTLENYNPKKLRFFVWFE